MPERFRTQYYEHRKGRFGIIDSSNRKITFYCFRITYYALLLSILIKKDVRSERI